MNRSPLKALMACVALGLSTPVMAETTDAVVAAPAPVNAVWVEKEIQFHYMGFTSYYSCDGLRDQVRRILEQVGARPGFKVLKRGCGEHYGPEFTPGMWIKAALPVEATPEVLAAIEAERPKQELVARATGSSGALNEATAQFPARPRRVEFEGDPRGPLRDGDCELLEQMRDRVLVPLGAKVVEDRTRCMPGQVIIGGVNMVLEVLEPLPEAAPQALPTQ
jgi:hypothetical protein